MKYEYKIVKFEHYGRDISGMSEEELINHYASKNWELVQAQLFNESYTYLYFKRKIKKYWFN